MPERNEPGPVPDDQWPREWMSVARGSGRYSKAGGAEGMTSRARESS